MSSGEKVNNFFNYKVYIILAQKLMNRQRKYFPRKSLCYRKLPFAMAKHARRGLQMNRYRIMNLAIYADRQEEML